MANFYASARSNYFRVKDRAKFDEAMEPLAGYVSVHTETGGEKDSDRVCLLVDRDDCGCWPSNYYDEATDEDIDIDVPQIVSEHLADDEVAVFMEAGAEKLRYVTGWATAINNRGEREDISLADIYGRAARLGANVSQAHY